MGFLYILTRILIYGKNVLKNNAFGLSLATFAKTVNEVKEVNKAKNMQLKPLNDGVVIKPLKKEEITVSGIILPDTVEKEKSEKGEVVAVGLGCLLDSGQRAPMSVKVGDKILFKKYSPHEVKIDNEEYLIVEEKDILAIIE